MQHVSIALVLIIPGLWLGFAVPCAGEERVVLAPSVEQLTALESQPEELPFSVDVTEVHRRTDSAIHPFS